MAGTTGRGVVVADRCLFITTARSRRSTRFARSASAPAGWTCNPSTIWLRFRGEDAAWRASGVILMRLSRPKDCALIYQVKLGSDENTFAGPSPSEIVWERLHATKLAGTHLCRRGIARHIHPAPCQRCLSSYVNSMMARENGRVLVSLRLRVQASITITFHNQFVECSFSFSDRDHGSPHASLSPPRPTVPYTLHTAQINRDI
mmetsp:Transcript_23406/g.71691  ORF Transcript_23406/g.71691 Transcript_23406/m.71691 type:complete len:204 (-) Transcript_23406:125-736(-)